MRTSERVAPAMVVIAGVPAFGEPRVRAVLVISAVLALVTGFRAFAAPHVTRTGLGAGLGIGARPVPSTDGGSFSLAAGASPHPHGEHPAIAVHPRVV
ncbi:hypothetical protein KIPE111705_43155 [Kibdelosporangium persicum]